METPIILQIALLISGVIMSAVVGWAIGNHKNQAIAGIFFGLVLGPIGWIITAFLPHEGPKCPHCGGVLKTPGVPKCMHCGGDIAFMWVTKKAGPSIHRSRNKGR